MEPIRSVFENDPDMREIVQEFAAELPSRIADLQEMLAANRRADMQTVAHQLKGAGGGYGHARGRG